MIKTIKKNMETSIPFIVLLLLLVIFTITTKGKLFTGSNLTTIVRQTLNNIIAALGLLFVAALGGTDITQGSLAGLAGACATMVALSTNNLLLSFAAAIGVGLLSGFFLGAANGKFKVPSFMCSLSMLIALRAMVTIALGGSSIGIVIPDFIKALDSMLIKIPVVIVLVVVVVYIYNYTPFGAYCRAIGENENAVVFSGLNVTKVKIAAFTLSGLFTGIASMFVLARVGGCSTTLGLGFEMRILMAMFIGGIPVKGGEGTKVYKLIVGAFIISLLENGLVLSGSSGAVTQMVRGVVLLLVVYIMLNAGNKLNKT